MYYHPLPPQSRAALTYRILFFLSGATGLVYQLLWIRLLYQAFGSTIQSVTTVVAAYMGGLGLGAWLLGRRADRHPRPAMLYGWLEIGIGIYAVLSPFVLQLARSVYVGIAGATGVGGVASIALRFGLAALVLLVPTTLMGATLPVLTRAFTGEVRANLKRELASLYGLNTLGAVIGTAFAGFFLIEHVGIRTSLWLTAALNVALGVLAVKLARPLAPLAAETAPPAVRSGAARDPVRTGALVLLGLTAFASLLYEIAWTRVLVMIVGGSSYAFTLILLVFLLGIGIGSALIARRNASPGDPASGAALAQGLTAVGAALLFLFFSALPVYIIAIFQVQFLGATGRLLLMAIAVGFVVLIPAIGMGMTFPLLVDLVAERDRARGADVGRAYGLNTLGSIVGAVLTGFVLVVWLGSDLTLRFGLVLSALSAFALAFLAARGVAEGTPEHARLRSRVLGAGALAMAAGVIALAAPRWNTRLIDLGPTIYGRRTMNRAGLDAFLASRGDRQLAFQEGWNATVSVWESAHNRYLKVNGKTDASDFGDMDTQVVVGLAAAAARPDAHSALIIGYGSGVSAGVLAAVPGMARVKIVELEPAVLAMDPYFRHVNGAVLQRPSVTAVADDARSALQMSRERFDVVVSEPSNPWVAGVATLYTPEFFQIARSRLAEDGVFGQWIQLYQLPISVLAGIVKNLRSVFPYVEIWWADPESVVLLAAARPIRYDRAWLGRLLGPGAPLDSIGREWLGMDQVDDYFGRFVMGPGGVARLIERATLVHSDDRPELEFVAARSFIADQGTPSLLDTLIQLRPADEGSELTTARLARAFGARGADPRGLPYVEAARREHPGDPEWAARAALIRLGQGDTAAAREAIDQGLARTPRHAQTLLAAAFLELQRRDLGRAQLRFQAVLAAGGDTALARTGLAIIAARGRVWEKAAAEIRRALAASRHTLRHSVAPALVNDVLTPLAFEGPPLLADSVLVEVQSRIPGWGRMHELRAVTALRLGACEQAADQLLALIEFGMSRADAPSLLEGCNRDRALRRG